MKKRFKECRLVVLCLLCLCLLGGCMPDYSDGSGESYSYEVQWLYQGETAPDEYYIRTDSKIYCFSVSTGELLPIMEYPGYRPRSGSDDEDSRITEYVVREDAVWFATIEDENGRNESRNKLWKYDRETGVCELFLEAEKDIWRLGEHEGWLLYGGRDIYACPVDGKPGEDSINLWEQRGEILRDDDAWPYMRISEFQAWYMGKTNNSGLVFVQDKESGEPLLPIDDDYMAQGFGAGCCVNGELIFFLQHGIMMRGYMRDDGQGFRRIQCLQDSQYDAAWITGRHVVAEDGKIIVLLQVTRNDWNWLTPDQDELNNDVLFEIDLAANTDRLIYGTKDKNTRIVGYRRGALYLLEDDVIYRESLEGGDRERIYDLRDSKVELYNRRGEHKDVKLTMWGDYLIVEGYSVEEITGIPLENREDYVISKADR